MHTFSSIYLRQASNRAHWPSANCKHHTQTPFSKPRLGRMLLQLQKYDLDVRFVGGKNVPISDLLSRQPLPDTHEIAGFDLQVRTVIRSLFITDKRLETVRSATLQDPQMRILKQTILEGWPDLRTECPKQILDFWNHRDELSAADDLIFRGQTLLIPNALRQQLVESVHTGHMDTQKCLQRAKDVMFWPGMAKQISDYVLSCSICLNNRNANQEEPLTPHEIPTRPWQKLGSDLFSLEGKDYLVIVDYYSRYFEVNTLPDTRSSTVIRKLKAHFSRHGILVFCTLIMPCSIQAGFFKTSRKNGDLLILLQVP